MGPSPSPVHLSGPCWNVPLTPSTAPPRHASCSLQGERGCLTGAGPPPQPQHWPQLASLQQKHLVLAACPITLFLHLRLCSGSPPATCPSPPPSTWLIATLPWTRSTSLTHPPAFLGTARCVLSAGSRVLGSPDWAGSVQRGLARLSLPRSTGCHSRPSVVWCLVLNSRGDGFAKTTPKTVITRGSLDRLWVSSSPVLPPLDGIFPKSFRWRDFPAGTNGPQLCRHQAQGLAFRPLSSGSGLSGRPCCRSPCHGCAGCFLMPGVPCLAPPPTGASLLGTRPWGMQGGWKVEILHNLLLLLPL